MIRRYETRDRNDVLQVWHDASRLAHPFLDRRFLERERVEIAENHLPKAETWVYVHEGRSVAFVSLLDNEVGGLFVSPAHHRRGIARALMDHARALHGALELSVFEANGIGRAFYNAYGFEVIGRAIEPRTGHPELRMRLPD